MSEDIVERKPDDYVDIPALQAALRRTFDCFADTTILEAINALGMLEQKLIDSVPKSEAWDAICAKSSKYQPMITERDAEIERLREALKIISCKCKSNCGKDEGNCLYWIARSALQQKDTE